MKINEIQKKRLQTLVLTELKKNEAGKATLIVSAPLDARQTTAFYDAFPFLKGKELEKIHNPDLIAGFVLKWGSKMIDASLTGRIDRIVNKSLRN